MHLTWNITLCKTFEGLNITLPIAINDNYGNILKNPCCNVSLRIWKGTESNLQGEYSFILRYQIKLKSENPATHNMHWTSRIRCFEKHTRETFRVHIFNNLPKGGYMNRNVRAVKRINDMTVHSLIKNFRYIFKLTKLLVFGRSTRALKTNLHDSDLEIRINFGLVWGPTTNTEVNHIRCISMLQPARVDAKWPTENRIGSGS